MVADSNICPFKRELLLVASKGKLLRKNFYFLFSSSHALLGSDPESDDGLVARSSRDSRYRGPRRPSLTGEIMLLKTALSR